mmetsp:Transcript_4365/g.9226  ORF Transcript_4365/g.9226 Transcript_4365/m.9226 type:complete len:439 (-) Transcript_4365:2363-3679(-)
MADTGHHTSLGNHGNGSESELLRSHHGSNGDIASSTNATIDAEGHAVTEVVVHQSGVGLAQSQLPGSTCMLDRGEGTGSSASIASGDLDDIGISLGDTAGNGSDTDGRDKLDGNSGLFVDGVEVVDELGKILNTVDVMVGRRRDQGDTLLTGTKSGDVLRNLRSRKLTSLTGLGALGDLDFVLLGGDKELRRHSEAATGDLMNVRVGRISVLETGEVGEGGTAAPLVDIRDGLAADDVLSALSGVGLASHAVDGDGEGLVGLAAQSSEGHGAGAEPLHDLGGILDLLDGDGLAVGVEIEQVTDVGEGGGFKGLLEDLVVGDTGGLDSVVGELVAVGVGTDLLVKSNGIMQELGEIGGVDVVLSHLGDGLVVSVVDQLELSLSDLRPHHDSLTGDLLKGQTTDAAGGSLETALDDILTQTNGLKNLSTGVGREERDTDL